ncbi:uncharacterized protein BO96DRAFT_465200 [Aspergillus niger CBS 101883]|uniref:uncharacterized protein n=1 Tax=Aspergillus lacticoffeatus (strain CBS 101883) TaxID=1450533 RepID=UPI000D7F75CD|nr:uncharacterized protein BO96DRAFT_465200 [Aspergillus niger CBS 101883]PYH57579.1 hypothetical protein BO96DRAFT_465200 [Aspergillus niger CBS 101883]
MGMSQPHWWSRKNKEIKKLEKKKNRQRPDHDAPLPPRKKPIERLSIVRYDRKGSGILLRSTDRYLLKSRYERGGLRIISLAVPMVPVVAGLNHTGSPVVGMMGQIMRTSPFCRDQCDLCLTLVALFSLTPLGYWDCSTPGSALLNLVVLVSWQRPELFCMRSLATGGANLVTYHAVYEDPGLFALQRFGL